MNTVRAVIFALAASLLFGLGAANADATFGPGVGVRAPALGALPDQTGKLRKLSDLTGKKGVVLVFYRSAGWCPYCQAQLMALNAGAADIQARGYNLVGLSYDDPAVAKTFADKRAITYALLSDPKSAVIDSWGLRDPQYPVGHRAYGVPRPAIFVLNRKGVVKASLAEQTYQKRPPVAEVIKALDGIK